jgi:hypothetical protein
MLLSQVFWSPSRGVSPARSAGKRTLPLARLSRTRMYRIQHACRSEALSSLANYTRWIV